MPNTINLDIGFFAHPKVVRLTTLLGTGSEARLLQLYCYIARYRPETGGFDDWTPEEVEAAAHWSGEKNLFVESLLKCGLLHQREIDGKNGYFVHDWKEHQPHLVNYTKVRKVRQKAINERWDKEKKRGKYKHGKEMESDTKSIQNVKFVCSNFSFCNTNAVQCNAVQCNTYTPLSPSQKKEIAERLVDHYAEMVKPKKLDNSGSRTKFIATAMSILERGTHVECLTRAIDNYASSRAETEESDDEIKFRFGFQTFFGPKEQHWKDFAHMKTEAKDKKDLDILNAEMTECENRVAGMENWSPVGMAERFSDDVG